MPFKEVQQEVRSNDDLCLFLKYPLRLSTIVQVGISGMQIFVISNQNLQFQSFIYWVSIITELLAILFALGGLYYSFNQIHTLQSSETTYYDKQDEYSAKILFIGNSLISATILTLAIINPTIYNIGMQTKIASINYTSLEDFYLFEESLNQFNSMIFVTICLIQIISQLFAIYVYLLFCGNSSTFYQYIYIFSISVGFLSIRVFYQKNNIIILEKVEYITKLNNAFLVQFISAGAFIVSLIILSLFSLDFIGIYYRTFKQPLYKFLIGNILIAMTFAFIGSDGQLIRNLQKFQEIYQTPEGCRTYMQMVPEDVLEQYGCKQKYLINTNCPQTQLTQQFEHSQQNIGCLNWNCCGILSQALLREYISYCLEVNLMAVYIVMLCVMLFQIKQVEENALSQTFKQIILVLQVCFILGGIVMVNLPSDIQIYRKTYVQPKDFVSLENVSVMKESSSIILRNQLPRQCKQHAPQELIDELQTKCLNDCGVIEVILQIKNSEGGQFIIIDYNKDTTFIDDSGSQLYLRSDGNELLILLTKHLQVCINSASTEINWRLQEQHLNSDTTADNVLHYQNINVQASGKGILKLYNTLLLDCIANEQAVFKEINNNNNNNNQQDIVTQTFYNYPVGVYGTIIYEQEEIHQCSYFNIRNNYNLQIPNLSRHKLLITLQWFGSLDLDLIVQNTQCQIGSKYQHICGGMYMSNDSTFGNQQYNEGQLSFGEQIVMDFIADVDYKIYVEANYGGQENEQLLFDSFAMVQIFAEGSKEPQITLSVRQLLSTSVGNLWECGYVRSNGLIEIINSIK